MLARINRELDGNFDLAQFDHVARLNDETRSVEMHLRSMCKQKVTIPAANLTVEFQEYETIWTESSHKYSQQEVCSMAEATGFRCDTQWIDDRWPFAESLLIAE